MVNLGWQFPMVPILWLAAAAGSVVWVGALLAVRGPFRQAKPLSSHVTLPIHSLLWVHQPHEIPPLLSSQPGVRTVRLDLASGVAHVTFDPVRTSAGQLRDFVDHCAHHCRGDQAPAHSCPPTLNDD